jgi:hypothetical protein
MVAFDLGEASCCMREPFGRYLEIVNGGEKLKPVNSQIAG